MASSALEEKINKIRQQNEEIRRRHEEVEEDKKNAAKSNALVQMVPSSDWPERKEPPEFSNPPRVSHKVKPIKEHSEYSHQHYVGGGEGKKLHAFAQGEGPPPDPKYNFLADFEREERTTDEVRDNGTGRGRGRNTRGNFKKKGPGREGYHKDQRIHYGTYRDDCPPEYDAWRAERNRIDEDRISRQRTAEGNWRREWDNDKVHIVDDVAKRESRSNLGNFIKRDHKDFDRRYHGDNNEHLNHNRGNVHRPHQGPGKNYHSGHDHRYNNSYDHGYATPATPKVPVSSPGTDERTVIATDKSLKVTLNQGNVPKGSLMSVKVNSPSIAGTGRVGPRQRTRVTYSGHSDMEANAQNSVGFLRQKSFEDKSRNVHSNNAQNSNNLRRSYSQKKKDTDTKSPYMQKKEFKKDGNSQNLVCPPKSPKTFVKNVKILENEYINSSSQPNKESKELYSDNSINVEQPQNETNEIKNDTVLCESDMCLNSVQKIADIKVSGTHDIEASKANCATGAAQNENSALNLEINKDAHQQINNSDSVINTENADSVSREAVIDDINIKSVIDDLSKSVNGTITKVAPSRSITIPDSFEKSAANEQSETDNMSLKESEEVINIEKGDNVSKEEIVELVPDNSFEESKELLDENVEADAEKNDGAEQAEVVKVADHSSNSLLATHTDSVIAVDSQQNNKVEKNVETLPTENVVHAVDVNEQKTVKITSNEVSESEHAEKVKVQDVIETDNSLLATQTDSVITVDSQQNNKVEKNVETLPTENVIHAVDVNEQETVKITSNEVSESEPAEKVKVQDVIETDNSLSATRTDSVIAVDSQQNNKVEKNVETLPTENVIHAVDVNEQETVKIIGNEVSESEPAEKVKVQDVMETDNSLLATQTDSVIAVDSQQNNKVEKNVETLPTENVIHAVDVNEQETVKITSNEVSESEPAEKVKVQDVMETDNQVQSDHKVVEQQKIEAVQEKEQDPVTDTIEDLGVVSDEHLASTAVSDNKTTSSLAAEMQSVIETVKQLDCDNEPVEAKETHEPQETQEIQETAIVDIETNMNVKEAENVVFDKQSHAVTVESDNNDKCLLSPLVETNSVIDANNQMKESGDSSKLEVPKTESVLLECKEDTATCVSDDKCSEIIEAANENLAGKNMSDNDENGAISDNVESQTKCSNISDEIEDNKVKATEFVMECSKE